MNTRLESDRLILENYHKENIELVQKLLSEPLVWKFSSRTPTSDIKEASKYFENVMKNYDEDICDF